MVVINPVQIWYNGQLKEATILLASINDNLKNSGLIYYRLLTENREQLSEGNLTMTGEAYQGWENNEYAYSWIAAQLNLTIVGNLTTTTTTTSTTENPTESTTTTSTTTVKS